MSPKPLNRIAGINLPVPHVFSTLTAVWGLPGSLQTEAAAQTQSTAGTHTGISFWGLWKFWPLWQEYVPKIQPLSPDNFQTALNYKSKYDTFMMAKKKIKKMNKHLQSMAMS